MGLRLFRLYNFAVVLVRPLLPFPVLTHGDCFRNCSPALRTMFRSGAVPGPDEWPDERAVPGPDERALPERAAPDAQRADDGRAQLQGLEALTNSVKECLATSDSDNKCVMRST